MSIGAHLFRRDLSVNIYTGIDVNVFVHMNMCEGLCTCFERVYKYRHTLGEVGGWGRVPFSRNFMKPTPRRKWYLTSGRRFH